MSYLTPTLTMRPTSDRQHNFHSAFYAPAIVREESVMQQLSALEPSTQWTHHNQGMMLDRATA
jgi:hypothetical protein